MRLTPLVPALAALALAGCEPPAVDVPLDHPVFPTGLAVHPRGDRLAVVSSSFDLAFQDGALLLADLDLVRDGLEGSDAEDRRDAVVEGAYLEGATVLIPPFGDRPVLSSAGERLFLATRGSNLLSSIDLDPDAGFSCDGADGVAPRCGKSPRALQLPENDPFDVLLLAEVRDADDTLTRVDGLVTLLSSPTVYFFRDDTARPGAARMQITGTLPLGDAVRGVRATALRGGTTPLVVAALDTTTGSGGAGAIIALFEPSADATLSIFDVTDAMGAISLRDVLVVPGGGGVPDAVLALTRAPDAILRLELDDLPAGPALRLAGVAETCALPTSLALAFAGGVQRALLTCQAGGTIEALDPRTLMPTGAVRFAGRTPYDVAVNPTVAEAYVSFFSDDSIGVLSLVDELGEAALTFHGRIGTPTPKPEDGRE